MKKILAILLSGAMLLTGCSLKDAVDSSPESAEATTTTTAQTSQTTAADTPIVSEDTTSEEYIESLGFTSLNDPSLMRYVEDSVYSDLVNRLDSDEYFVENVETVYISKEYIDELAYNSQENIYFGYKLSELDQAFEGTKYIFTLGDDGQTTVKEFEEYVDFFDRVIRNVAIGTGVILICVTVSVVSAGVGAPAVSMIFAASAKTATTFAVSSGVISGVSEGIIEGFETHDFGKALKAAVLGGSEGYKIGAITGAIVGGAGEAIALKGATLNGLTMNEAAMIQKESKYPLDVIKQFSSMEQYEICKDAGLTPQMIRGNTALVRNIDLDYVNKDGLTNLQLMQQGNAAIDPVSGLPYELHHIGQKTDSTIAILTKAEHMQNGNNSIWHTFGNASEVHVPGNNWDTQRSRIWKELAAMLAA